MAALSSATFVALAVLVTICFLHIEYANAACPSGHRNCGRDTRCKTNIRTDPKNCGNCCVTCPRRANSSPACKNGRCAIRCKPHYANCDNRNANGCEVNTLTNPNNCGRCNSKCPAYPNTIPACSYGHCTPMCQPGYADCNRNMSKDGCETLVAGTDPLNCGKCNSSCPAYPNTIPACSYGRCTAKCQPGYADCNRNMTKDGCETLVAGTDPLNCGKCGAPCQEDQYPFAVAKCTAGQCGILLCYVGMQDCNGKLEDGCEQNTFTDPNSCGSCGNVCPTYPNAVPLCANEFCRSLCQDGFDYCYASEIDERGCSKIFFDSDNNNCGRCNIKCDNQTQSCQQGVCKGL